MRLFVSALEYSANIHLKYLLREMIKRENIELCGIFDESIIGNLSLELHSVRLLGFGASQTPSLVSAPKISPSGLRSKKNYESQTENPSVVDSLHESNKNQSARSANPIKSFCYFWLIPKVESPLPLNPNSISGKSLCDISEVAVMGFIDVLKRAKFFLQLRAKCVNLALSADKILLMDSSSFNIPLAKRVKKRDSGKMIMYYILPQVWAWKPWRARVIEANCDRLAAILPFEVKCYEKKAKFVGHPLLDEIKAFRGGNSFWGMQFAPFSHKTTLDERSSSISLVSRKNGAKPHRHYFDCDSLHESTTNQAQNCNNPSLRGVANAEAIQNNEVDCHDSALPNLAMTKNGINSRNDKLFTFMPGSRLSEINRIFPIFLQVKDELKKRDSKAQFNLVVPKKFKGKNLSEIYGNLNDFHITFDAHTSLLQSTFAFICSGTATLECALIGTPFVLGYQGRWIEAFVVKQFLNIRFVGLANLLYSHIAPNSQFHIELLQENLNAKNLLDSYLNANPNDFLEKSLALRAYLKNGSARAVAQWLLEK